MASGKLSDKREEGAEGRGGGGEEREREREGRKEAFLREGGRERGEKGKEKEEKKDTNLEKRGIDPRTSRMRSGRSTI